MTGDDVPFISRGTARCPPRVDYFLTPTATSVKKPSFDDLSTFLFLMREAVASVSLSLQQQIFQAAS
jgi:hypothetical protein